MTFVHGEPCTQLVLNSGSYCAISQCRPTEFASDVYKGSSQALAHVGMEPRRAHLRLSVPRLLIRHLGRPYICTVPETLLLIHDTVPAGG